MADGNGAGHGSQRIFRIDMGHEPPALVDLKAVALGGAYSGALLTPVLKGPQAMVDQSGSVKPPGIDAKDPAFFTHSMVHGPIRTIVCTPLRLNGWHRNPVPAETGDMTLAGPLQAVAI